MADIPVGKFSVRPAVRFIDRWQVSMLEPMTFNDPVHGLLTVPFNFVSDLASIRILREVCRWCAVTALSGTPFSTDYPWTNTALWIIAVAALALYGILAGYAMRAAILHDWLYTTGVLSRRDADAVFERASHTGDGTAKWRTLGLFWPGVRLGGYWSYTKTPIYKSEQR